MTSTAAMQDQLNTLYETRWRDRQSGPGNDFDDRLRGPDLVWLAPAYMAATPRVLLVGQQPDGCDYSYGEFLSDWKVDRALVS